jgi:ElaB/YqjD/DUF883 family membrane-anchored ribosome-binding protein
MTDPVAVTDRLKDNLRAVRADLTEMGGQVSRSLGERATSVKEVAKELPAKGKEALASAANATDSLIRTKPYHALGAAAVLGALASALFRRK